MRNYKFKILNLRFIFALVLLLAASPAAAQIQRDDWTTPFRLSTDRGSGSEATLLADDYGFVHAFWVEVMSSNNQPVITYSRFNGVNWTVPTVLYLGPVDGAIRNVTAAISHDPGPAGQAIGQETMHIIWTEGMIGPVFRSSAPLNETLSAQNWTRRFRINVPASHMLLKIDSTNTMHLLYTRSQGTEAGVYYIQSEDEAITWSIPRWLDPDILPGHQPAWLQFVMDDREVLHATWFYLTPDGSSGDWVRYIQSQDLGQTWSTPFTIDRLDEVRIAAEERLSEANPVLAAQGDQVHVIWAGGTLHFRNHRYSQDGGRTWSPRNRTFGGLNGQAGEGLIPDAAGRFHFLSQIRFPQGIYHFVWDGQRWSPPQLIYLISLQSGDPIGNRIHAHRTFPVIRGDNQLILTFTDPPPVDGRRLFATYHTLTDIPPAEVLPTPQPTATSTPAPAATEGIHQTATPATLIPNFTEAAPPPVAGPDSAVRRALVPVLLLTGAFVLLQLIIRKFRT